MFHASFLLAALFPVAFALPAQVVVDAPVTRVPHTDHRIHGRFIHVTDLHPDPYYKAGTHPRTACHRQRGRAGYYGTAYSECDSPLALVDVTLDWLDEHWSNDIDFVIWTGDSARHDNDVKIPRRLDEIYDLNRATAKKMERVFLAKGIPVIPTLGNNDVWPHNTLVPGRSNITETYKTIWSNFIPSSSLTSFLHGGYFFVEVVPDGLAVISLNTMHFFESNEAAGGCSAGDDEDAGNQQFMWLEAQLSIFRSRQMQVWVIGHIPPSKDDYYPRCFFQYVDLALRFQDTILGHLFGHLNTDHFYFLKADDLSVDTQAILHGSTSRKTSLFETLITDFLMLPDPGDETDHDHHAVVNVNPSVVPNPYIPAFRVYAYNITGLTVRDAGTRKCHQGSRGLDGECGKHSNIAAPSRRNSLWTPLGYAQYWMPRVEDYTEGLEAEYQLEYLTFSLSMLHARGRDQAAGGGSARQAVIPLRNLPMELRDPDVRWSSYAPYELADLTIGSWLELGWRIGQGREKRLGRRFKEFLYMEGL